MAIGTINELHWKLFYLFFQNLALAGSRSGFQQREAFDTFVVSNLQVQEYIAYR